MTYKNGEVIKVLVTGITKFGIFVKADDDYTGLIHISEMSTKFVPNPKSFAEIGELIYAEVIEIDEEEKHLKLSIKNIYYRKNGGHKKKIVETKHGFATLEYKLPFWIEENIKNHEKE